MEIYYTISSDIINNFSILHNIKEFYRYNEIIIKDLNKIISEKSIEDIMKMYLKLNNKTENIIGNKLNINKHFEFKENNRYQKQINNFFKTKSEILKKNNISQIKNLNTKNTQEETFRNSSNLTKNKNIIKTKGKTLSCPKFRNSSV